MEMDGGEQLGGGCLFFLDSVATGWGGGGGKEEEALLNGWNQAHQIWYRADYEYTYTFCVMYCLCMSTVTSVVAVQNFTIISAITYAQSVFT
jgi:hypothetical protein